MQRSLINTFLGILTTSEVHELIDIFRGKGRRKITPYLEEYLNSVNEEDLSDINHSKHSFIPLDTVSDAAESQLDLDSGQSAEELKGVLFILDSFRKTRKYQNLLKSKEVINLYSLIKGQAISRSNEIDSNNTAKSKGVLINKKHY